MQHEALGQRPHHAEALDRNGDEWVAEGQFGLAVTGNGGGVEGGRVHLESRGARHFQGQLGQQRAATLPQLAVATHRRVVADLFQPRTAVQFFHVAARHHAGPACQQVQVGQCRLRIAHQGRAHIFAERRAAAPLAAVDDDSAACRPWQADAHAQFTVPAGVGDDRLAEQDALEGQRRRRLVARGQHAHGQVQEHHARHHGYIVDAVVLHDQVAVRQAQRTQYFLGFVSLHVGRLRELRFARDR
ncbi:hypothetical protein GCM10011572_17090 [Pseudoduganella buxea]|uniref:Uncharacterized protein n=1 Tax=Pseudoduganella buxea TaxID=1949069 RepID=A0ABQ1KD25_9BURK|nr:hypothetical protein GCM10011572_17090 [Pseudoduganella buxea]